MDISEALQTVRSLAEGIDPITGEIFPDDGLYQHPRVIRLLYEAVGALEGAEEKQRRENHLPGKAGKPWSGAEDKLLIDHFKAAMLTNRVSAAAQSHGRNNLGAAGKIRQTAAGYLPKAVCLIAFI
jgi:hypothetical protein